MSEKIVKARKVHRCWECEGPINPGEQYHQFSTWMQGPVTLRTHIECTDLHGGGDDE